MQDNGHNRVAVIGSGIAGLTTAWLLSSRYEVHVFERSKGPGMDFHSLDVPVAGDSMRVDVPVRVVKAGYYPNLIALYRHLGLALEPVYLGANFAVDGERPYFRFRRFRFLSDAARPWLDLPRSKSAWQILLDTLRLPGVWHRDSLGRMSFPETLEAWFARNGFSDAFVHKFFVPAFSTICTCSHASVLRMPATTALGYYLTGGESPATYRVRDGIAKVVGSLLSGVDHVHLSTTVRSVDSDSGSARLTLESGEVRTFRYVVVCSQANHAAGLLTDAGQSAERSLLQSVRYEPVRVVTHRDTSFLPADRRKWSVLNFALNADFSGSMVSVWMNAFRKLEDPWQDVLLQTVNPLREPSPELTIAEASFERAVAGPESGSAWTALTALNSEPDRRIFFAGSYVRPGIPLLESAASSAVDVARRLGVTPPWESPISAYGLRSVNNPSEQNYPGRRVPSR